MGLTAKEQTVYSRLCKVDDARSIGRSLLDFVSICWLVLYSGSVFFHLIYTEQSLLVSVILSILLLLTGEKKRFPSKAVVFVLFTSTVLVFTPFIHREILVNSYLGAIVRIWLALVVTSTIGFSRFVEDFLKLMYCLSLMSIVFFFVALFVPSYVINLPVIVTSGGERFANAIFHVYKTPSWGLLRNSSIFWEPGAYQAFLNIALLFSIFQRKPSGRFIGTGLIITALITTFSTTGYLLFMINIGIISVRLLSRRRVLLVVVLLLLLMMITFIPVVSRTVIDKFDRENASFSRRLLDAAVDLELFFQHPFFGIGFQQYYEEFPYLLSVHGKVGTDSSNSLTRIFAVFGLPFGIFLVMVYLKFFMIFSEKLAQRILLLGYFFILFSSQGLLFLPFFFSLALYGLSSSVIVSQENQFRGSKMQDSFSFLGGSM